MHNFGFYITWLFIEAPARDTVFPRIICSMHAKVCQGLANFKMKIQLFQLCPLSHFQRDSNGICKENQGNYVDYRYSFSVLWKQNNQFWHQKLHNLW